MKSLAVVAVLAAIVGVVGLAAIGRARAPVPDQDAAAPRAEGERYAMSIGRPIELTQGERQQLIFLVPGIDPNMIPVEATGNIRAILYGRGNDAEKRSRIKSLLR